jgi:hypothetical protein
MEQLEALRAFIARRSGIEPANYGDRKSFMADYRCILRDGRDARKMLRYLELATRNAAERGAPMTSPVTLHDRLEWSGKAWRYHEGQYYPTEYRAAACLWLARAITIHWDIPHSPQRRDAIVRTARNAFGPGIAKRWFA